VKRLADLVFVVLAIGLVGFAVRNNEFGDRSVAEAREGFYAHETVARELATTDKTLRILLVLSTSCRFCDESVGLYNDLQQAASKADSNFEVAAVSNAPRLAFQRYLVGKGLPSIKLESGPVPPDIPGTPALLVIEKNGRVVASWVGKLSGRQERTLKEGLARAKF
jgi:hypothetical protein